MQVSSKDLESIALRNRITKNIEAIKEDIALLKELLEKINRKEVSNTIKEIEKNVRGADAELIVNAPDITPYKTEILKQNPTRSFTDNMTLQRDYLWRTYASGDIGGKDDIRDWGMIGLNLVI